MATAKSCSDNLSFKHIQKSLVFERVDIYKARIRQIEKYIKKEGISTAVLDEEYEQLTEVLTWYEEKKKALREAFPKSCLHDAGTFQPHEDLCCLFVPLASFNSESQINEHLAKMIIAYLGDTKIPRTQHEDFFAYLLSGLNTYLGVDVIAEDVYFLSNSLNDPDFLEQLLQIKEQEGSM